MERCQTAIISSIIVVFCYVVNTAFTPIPTFGGQLICKASQKWSCILGVFCQQNRGMLGKAPFLSARYCLAFSMRESFCLCFVLQNHFRSFEILLSSSSAASAWLVRISQFLLCLCPESTNSISATSSYSASYTSEKSQPLNAMATTTLPSQILLHSGLHMFQAYIFWHDKHQPHRLAA